MQNEKDKKKPTYFPSIHFLLTHGDDFMIFSFNDSRGKKILWFFPLFFFSFHFFRTVVEMMIMKNKFHFKHPQSGFEIINDFFFSCSAFSLKLTIFLHPSKYIFHSKMTTTTMAMIIMGL